jgi:glycosyltransferase involved in cell wall biosynthesis
MNKISAILCTHNPREDYLHRVLEALRAQTLPMAQWELLLIDNASQSPLSGQFDLAWHPNARHVREEELGLTPARLRGVRESNADILVFVDDDAVLAADYLEQALVVGEQWPFVGAWGGSVIPEYEKPLPDWVGDQVWRLTVVDVKEDIWSNLREGFVTIPAGAGMCVRKNVCRHFLERCRNNKDSRALGRKGTELSGYEDVELAHCAMDLGLGTGKSTRLRLTHLIPASRLTLDYFVRQAEGDAASWMLFRAIRGLPVKEPTSSFIANVNRHLRRLLSRKPREIFEMAEASRRGFEKGWKLAKEYLEAGKSKEQR